jgi:hypothetical protein
VEKVPMVTMTEQKESEISKNCSFHCSGNNLRHETDVRSRFGRQVPVTIEYFSARSIYERFASILSVHQNDEFAITGIKRGGAVLRYIRGDLFVLFLFANHIDVHKKSNCYRSYDARPSNAIANVIREKQEAKEHQYLYQRSLAAVK